MSPDRRLVSFIEYPDETSKPLSESREKALRSRRAHSSRAQVYRDTTSIVFRYEIRKYILIWGGGGEGLWGARIITLASIFHVALYDVVSVGKTERTDLPPRHNSCEIDGRVAHALRAS